MLEGKKYSATLVQDGKAGLTQEDHCDKHRDYCNGILQKGRERG